MAQYLIHPKHPLRTAIYIILALGLVVGGYFTFKASQTSTEGRSKASSKGTPVGGLGFNFLGDTQGWVMDKGTPRQLKHFMFDKDADYQYTGDPTNNTYSGQGGLRVDGSEASASSGISSSGPYTHGIGNKEIKIRMALIPKKGNKINGCCVFEIYGSLKEGETSKLLHSLKFDAKNDGSMHVYTIKVPTIGNIFMTKARIGLPNLGKGDTAKIDYIEYYLN